jgi:hypothetical protein
MNAMARHAFVVAGLAAQPRQFGGSTSPRGGRQAGRGTQVTGPDSTTTTGRIRADSISGSGGSFDSSP